MFFHKTAAIDLNLGESLTLLLLILYVIHLCQWHLEVDSHQPCCIFGAGDGYGLLVRAHRIATLGHPIHQVQPESWLYGQDSKGQNARQYVLCSCVRVSRWQWGILTILLTLSCLMRRQGSFYVLLLQGLSNHASDPGVGHC